MGTEAKGLVLMNKENGILSKELGSYTVHEGIELVFKAFVEEAKVSLFLTTDRDVTDEEYNRIFDEYNIEGLESEGVQIEEVDEEYNPVWCYQFAYTEEHMELEEIINHALSYHKDQLKTIFNGLSES